jgi:hypothetical protein
MILWNEINYIFENFENIISDKITEEQEICREF